ncbi:hypothetical protein HG530_009639 [Fusarium avenaceum]|nr:hypothetical protein HG530_009639 [Fusarium avenaceum]
MAAPQTKFKLHSCDEILANNTIDVVVNLVITNTVDGATRSKTTGDYRASTIIEIDLSEGIAKQGRDDVSVAVTVERGTEDGCCAWTPSTISLCATAKKLAVCRGSWLNIDAPPFLSAFRDPKAPLVINITHVDHVRWDSERQCLISAVFGDANNLGFGTSKDVVKRVESDGINGTRSTSEVEEGTARANSTLDH